MNGEYKDMKKRVLFVLAAIILVFAVGCAAEEESVAETQLLYQPPVGFTADEKVEGLYRSPDYPEDTSNIMVVTDKRTGDFKSYDEAYFKKNCLEAVALTADVAKEDISYSMDKVKVAGYDAVKTEISYEEGSIKQIQYTVFVDDSDKLWIFTLTQTGDADWAGAFERSINGSNAA